MKIVIKFFCWLFSVLSWEKAEVRGERIGRFLYFLGIRKKIVMDNLNLVFASPDTPPDMRKTPDEIKRICRKSYENLGVVLAYYFRGHIMNKQYFDERWDVEGEQYLREQIEKGRRVIFIGGHIGVWEFAIMKLAAMGYSAGLIAKEIKNKDVDDWIVGIRSQNGVRTFSSKGSREEIVDAVKGGMCVIAVYDQSMTMRRGIVVDFLGRPASTVKSTPGIIRETQAVTLVGYARRIAPGRCRLYFTPEIPWVSDPDEDKERLINTQNYSNALSRVILESPEDWFWMHRRWKKRG